MAAFPDAIDDTFFALALDGGPVSLEGVVSVRAISVAPAFYDNMLKPCFVGPTGKIEYKVEYRNGSEVIVGGIFRRQILSPIDHLSFGEGVF